ncbi:CarboxypepD_reg-like domain-containing protein [Maribacter sedimenticola]|uniref:CarboxypepD_reg-like domain-containing protein n=1 Tax=Maribacter sedimenticola TaxID=228956 RepID=A0ABY1SJR0_9FLAO|nr:carboxypeptidase-like regulatory domain-containing protein [Maribacter sedimenticola]SNR65712.1 CarboxypepD_reg-like domain-containing protein [Maribacter sedimenticola]
MKSFLGLLIVFSSLTVWSQTRETEIKGVVTSYGAPLPNANISLKGSSSGIQTDSNGKYAIIASPWDILVFSYMGMKTVEIIVEDVTKILNIELLPVVQELDEVTVEQKKLKGQESMAIEYATKKSIIRTAYGFIDAENAGYEMNFVDGASINSSAIYLADALIGVLPGLRRGDGNTVLLRGGGSLENPRPPIFEIDGVIFTETPDFLDLSSIDRIAIIPGLKGSIKYGNIASGGVIIINTKGKFLKREEGSDKPYDQAKLRNNKYNESMATSTLKRSNPIYITKMDEAINNNKLTEVFLEQEKIYGSSPYFYLTALKHFNEKSTNDFIGQIETKLLQKFEDNPNVLKGLAYLYENQNRVGEALSLYKKIFVLRPRYTQSYRDLANMYVVNKQYQKGLGIYARYKSFRKLDTIAPIEDGIDAVMDTETTNLMALHADQLSISSEERIDGDIGGIRILFEWNNSEAEFDLQFVNPQARYFTWSHSLENESERIYDEKIKGYSCKQFLIDETQEGVWKVNLKYLGNKGFDPTYLKTTVYYDYGRPSQKETIQITEMSEKNINRALLSIVARNKFGK